MQSLRTRLKFARAEYPGQFWLLFWGVMLSTTGTSMVWPFIMIYATKELHVPLTQATLLMTLNSIAAIIFSFISGHIADRFGRKGVMVASLMLHSLGFILMSQANTFGALAVAMTLRGACMPLYQVGSDAMMADMIPNEKRADAYSLLRTSNNVGVALGPMIGGAVSVFSYNIAFLGAAVCMALYGLLIIFLARETLQKQLPSLVLEHKPKDGGFFSVLRDSSFIQFTIGFTLTSLCSSIMWVLLGVYTQHNYGLSEAQYRFIPTTNALMVIFLQVAVTQFTKRRPALPMMALGAFFFAIGVGSVALGRGFWAFWLSMVVMTVGELIATPTGTTWAANHAPANMRGRYMSVYGLTWAIASGIGPVMGGILNDQVGPQYTWYAGLTFGLISSLAFLWMARNKKNQSAAIIPPAQLPS